MDVFDEWRSGGTEIHWQSTTAANNGTEVAVFTRRCGTPGAPALVCVHGFPTASIDYCALTRELGADFDIFLLDFPGYGLSDKPAAPYVYSLYDDARLLIHAITKRVAARGIHDADPRPRHQRRHDRAVHVRRPKMMRLRRPKSS